MIDEGAVSHPAGRGVRLKIKSGSTETVPDVRLEKKASSGARTRT
jgi:hypothetical protein